MAGKISAEELEVLEESVDLGSLAATLEAQQKMELEILSEDEMWSKLKSNISDLPKKTKESTPRSKNNSKTRKTIIWTLLLAAIVGMLTFYFFQNKSLKEIETIPQEEEEILMADNTTIRLAPSSYLSWDEKEYMQNRKFDLDGQAYFDVPTKGDFLVETALGQISVKGTSFDIWEIDDLRLRVQCYSGIVEVKNNAGRIVTLTVGQEVFLVSDDFSKVGSMTNIQPDWFSGGLNYQNVPFSSIFKDLNRFYGITVNSIGIDASIGFTGFLPMDDLKNALEIITAVSGRKNERPNQSSLVFKK